MDGLIAEPICQGNRPVSGHEAPSESAEQLRAAHQKASGSFLNQLILYDWRYAGKKLTAGAVNYLIFTGGGA